MHLSFVSWLDNCEAYFPMFLGQSHKIKKQLSGAVTNFITHTSIVVFPPHFYFLVPLSLTPASWFIFSNKPPACETLSQNKF